MEAVKWNRHEKKREVQLVYFILSKDTTDIMGEESMESLWIRESREKRKHGLFDLQAVVLRYFHCLGKGEARITLEGRNNIGMKDVTRE